MPVLETRRPRSGLAGSALTTGRTMRSEPLDRTPGMSSRTSRLHAGLGAPNRGEIQGGPPWAQVPRTAAGGPGTAALLPRMRGLSRHGTALSPSVSGQGGRGWTEGQAHAETPRGPGGQALQALHRMERSVLITEGFTGRQTEHRLRTVVGAKMGPRPVCGPLRPLCARPSPPGLGSARGPVSVPFLRCTRSWSRRGGGAGADPPRSPRGSLSLPSDLVQERVLSSQWGQAGET